MTKLVLMSDILRCSEKHPFYTDRSCKWLYYLFSKQIKDATGLDLSVELACDTKMFDRKRFYKLCGFNKVCEENYLEICKGKISDDAINYFQECFNDYVIIFQEAGALKQVVDKTDIKYIDIIISSIRFMEDLQFAFRSNIKEVTEKLCKYRIPDEHIIYQANRVKSYYWDRCCYINDYVKDSLLLCGQTEVDLSLIRNSKFISFMDFKDKINELSKQYPMIYYKSHPYCNPNSENEKFIRSFENIKIINENIYKLLSTEEFISVAALSSGTLTEAEYFGKTVHTISHRFVNYYKGKGDVQKNEFILITDDYYSPTFWADILSPIFKTKECKYFNFHNRKNLLRQTLNVWWGYEIKE